MQNNFVRPAMKYENEMNRALASILSETDIVDIRRLIYSYSNKISILPPAISNEFYMMYGRNEEDRKNLFDGIVAKTYSYYLHDWVVDHDIEERVEETQIAYQFLNEIGSKRLVECPDEVFPYYVDNVVNFIDAMWETRVLEPTVDNYFDILDRRACMYKGMFGAAAIAAHANSGELKLVESYAMDIYKTSKILDDISDAGQGERWNLADMIGKEAADSLQKGHRNRAIEHIRLTSPISDERKQHKQYLENVVHFLYQ